MIKSLFKRSWLSTIRKPSRTIILILILFVMANMLLATFAIKKSVADSMEAAKEKLGAIVYLQVDTTQLRAQMQATPASDGSTPTPATIPTITKDLVTQIADSSYIKDYTYSVSATANASGFKATTTTQNANAQQYQDALNNARSAVSNAQSQYNQARNNFNASQGSGGSGDASSSAAPDARSGFGSGQRRMFNFNFNVNITDPTLSQGDMTIEGIDNFNYVSGMEDGSVTLSQGIAYDDTNPDGVVISDKVASDNSLSVGSTITLNSVVDSSAHTFTITGIYTATDTNYDNNTIYMSVANAQTLMSSTQLSTDAVSNVKFYLTSASEKDAFLAEKSSLVPSGLTLNIDDSSYQTMVGPIQNIGSFANTIMWIIIAAAVIIITLIVVINVKDRRYEMGVLMSVGATRRNIIGQIFLELVIVATIGFLISTFSSQIVANKMGDVLMQQQVQQLNTQQSSQNNGQNGQQGFIARMGSSNQVQPIESIDVNATMQDYLLLFGAGYLIIIIAMILPSINILRYQPKTILSGKE